MGPTNESDEEPFEGEMNNFQSPCVRPFLSVSLNLPCTSHYLRLMGFI